MRPRPYLDCYGGGASHSTAHIYSFNLNLFTTTSEKPARPPVVPTRHLSTLWTICFQHSLVLSTSTTEEDVLMLSTTGTGPLTTTVKLPAAATGSSSSKRTLAPGAYTYEGIKPEDGDFGMQFNKQTKSKDADMDMNPESFPTSREDPRFSCQHQPVSNKEESLDNHAYEKPKSEEQNVDMLGFQSPYRNDLSFKQKMSPQTSGQRQSSVKSEHFEHPRVKIEGLETAPDFHNSGIPDEAVKSKEMVKSEGVQPGCAPSIANLSHNKAHKVEEGQPTIPTGVNERPMVKIPSSNETGLKTEGWEPSMVNKVKETLAPERNLHQASTPKTQALSNNVVRT